VQVPARDATKYSGQPSIPISHQQHFIVTTSPRTTGSTPTLVEKTLDSSQLNIPTSSLQRNPVKYRKHRFYRSHHARDTVSLHCSTLVLSATLPMSSKAAPPAGPTPGPLRLAGDPRLLWKRQVITITSVAGDESSGAGGNKAA
jgi:hypothetical protein